jgi:beta-lactamase superfamily II metal-dependent hydrolase
MMMARSLAAVIAIVLMSVAVAAFQTAAARTLDIYWIDVEGGAATLLVSPSGESLLVDGGWENDGRDAGRIAAAARQAGLTKIDHFVMSHYHADHAGSLPALAKLLPFVHCYDRGDFVEPMNRKWYDAYLVPCAGKRTVVKAGDTIPFAGVRVDVVASDGQLITKAINGGGANPLCATAEHQPHEGPENERMVSALFTFGRFTFLDLADLNWEKELELACPVNKVGHVTLWQAGRHGALDGAGAPGFLYAIKPQVVVVNNGPRKGLASPSPGAQKTMTAHYERLMKSPGIEDVWQVHLAMLDQNTDHNTAADRIANVEETADCKGNWIKASVRSDGTFTITNGRNGVSKTYRAH